MGKATENLARVTPIGLDLAKTVFQFTASARKASSPSLASFGRDEFEVFRPARALRGGDGSLRFAASLGPPARGARSRGKN
jgi:hypothetical protein